MISHRGRLTLSTVFVTGTFLAAVFIGLSLLSRFYEERSVRRVLSASIRELKQDAISDKEAPDIQEAHLSSPRFTFATLDQRGNVVAKQGAFPVRQGLGFQRYFSGGRQYVSESQTFGKFVLVGAADWTQTESDLNREGALLFVLWFVMEGIIGLVSWNAARATFRPLRDLTEQAATLSGTDLSGRLDSSDRAEFGEFAAQLNALLDRIEATARREEQFASDAAHELRTPLAVLKAKLETALLKERPAAEYRATCQSLVPEVDRLTHLVEMLLRSARATVAPAPIIDVSITVDETISHWLDRFEGQGVHLEASVPEEAVCVAIFPEELRTVLNNLLDNALKFSPKNSSCRVDLCAEEDSAVMRMSDQGPGIPADMLDSIFERFTQADDSRASQGHGIGLAICRGIVKARGGLITARNLSPGAEFTVRLPCADPAC